MLYTDRDALRTTAYGSTDLLRARMSIYEYQNPRRDLRPIVTEFLAEVTGPVLDMGCGVGGYTRSLRAAGHPVIAADLSRAMATAAGPPAVLADATALPLRSGSFGAVIALHMLYHVPDPRAAIAEAQRLLGPDGLMVISTNASEDKAALRSLHAEAAIAAGRAIPLHGLSEHFHLDLAESMAREMFGEVKRHDLNSEVRVPEPEPVVAFIDSIRPWYGSPPEVTGHVRRIVTEAIERDGAFTFATHSGFLVCK